MRDDQARHFDPDRYLDTESGRVYTPQRSAAAWERAYAELRAALQAAPGGAQLFVVVGIQGAGKTSWIRANARRLGLLAYFFDAALPAARHRARVLGIAKELGVRTCAVWIRTPVEEALARNRLRRSDHRVPEQSIRSVASLMEAPSTSEGFDEVIEITSNGSAIMVQTPEIRPLERHDYDQWRPLWDGYNAFYGRSGDTALAEPITSTTWERFLNPDEPVFALVATLQGSVVGLAHYLFHRSTTKIEPVCYLQDLFTDPHHRGAGVGRALIEGVYAKARAGAAKRVYWQTQAGNAPARALYDRVARHLGFIVYSCEPV